MCVRAAMRAAPAALNQFAARLYKDPPERTASFCTVFFFLIFSFVAFSASRVTRATLERGGCYAAASLPRCVHRRPVFVILPFPACLSLSVGQRRAVALRLLRGCCLCACTTLQGDVAARFRACAIGAPRSVPHHWPDERYLRVDGSWCLLVESFVHCRRIRLAASTLSRRK